MAKARGKRTPKKKTPPNKSQRLPRLKFEFAGEPLTKAEIHYWALELNLTEQHQRLLLKSNGGIPDRPYFCRQSEDGETEQSIVDGFLGLDKRPFGPDRGTDCVAVLLRLRNELPSFSIPIAWVDRDDLLLTFHAGDRAGEVWRLRRSMLDIDADADTAIEKVAPSLFEFLHLLTQADDPYEPITLALDFPKVRGKQLDAILKQLGCKVFKYPGVTYSQTPLPPAWQWPKYRRSESDAPAFLAVEKNLTYGYAPKCEARPPGHKMLRVDVSKTQRTACLKELQAALGDHAELVDG